MASRQAYLVCLLLLCPVLALAQDVFTARVSQNLDYVDVELCFAGKAPKSLYRHRKTADYSSGITHKGQALGVSEKEYSLELPDLPEDACIGWRTSLIDALKANDYRLIYKTGQGLFMNAALWFWKGPMERDLLVDVFLPAGLSISAPWKGKRQDIHDFPFFKYMGVLTFRSGGTIAGLPGFTQPAGRVIRLKKQIQSLHRFAVPVLVTVWLVSSLVQESAKNPLYAANT